MKLHQISRQSLVQHSASLYKGSTLSIWPLALILLFSLSYWQNSSPYLINYSKDFLEQESSFYLFYLTKVLGFALIHTLLFLHVSYYLDKENPTAKVNLLAFLYAFKKRVKISLLLFVAFCLIEAYLHWIIYFNTSGGMQMLRSDLNLSDIVTQSSIYRVLLLALVYGSLLVFSFKRQIRKDLLHILGTYFLVFFIAFGLHFPAFILRFFLVFVVEIPFFSITQIKYELQLWSSFIDSLLLSYIYIIFAVQFYSKKEALSLSESE